MTRKTISLRLEAYEALCRVKRPSESFSDVILRISRRRLSELLSSTEPREDLARHIEEVHEILNRTRVSEE